MCGISDKEETESSECYRSISKIPIQVQRDLSRGIHSAVKLMTTISQDTVTKGNSHVKTKKLCHAKEEN